MLFLVALLLIFPGLLLTINLIEGEKKKFRGILLYGIVLAGIILLSIDMRSTGKYIVYKNFTQEVRDEQVKPNINFSAKIRIKFDNSGQLDSVELIPGSTVKQ
jgi:hypothetical protein